MHATKLLDLTRYPWKNVVTMKALKTGMDRLPVRIPPWYFSFRLLHERLEGKIRACFFLIEDIFAPMQR